MNRKAAGKLYTEPRERNGLDRDGFEELLGAMARSGLVRLEDSVFEKDGKQIPFRYASLLSDAEPLVLNIRETASPLPKKKGRKKTPAAKVDRKMRPGSGIAAANLKAWRR